MKLCEILLMSIILVLGIVVIVTDFHAGVIKNKVLLVAIVFGVIINSIYITFFAKNFLLVYLLNWFAVSLISVLLYAFRFWAAGDSKLMITLAFLIPARYYENSLLLISGVYYIIFIFLLAYLYIIVESIVLAIKKKEYYRKHIEKRFFKEFIYRYFVSYLYLRTLTLILQSIMGEFYYTNQLFFTFINIFIILYIHEKEVFHKRTIILILFGINALLIIWSILQGSYTVNLDILHNYVIVLLAIFLRYLVSGYNYEEIQTSEVKKGMVLSYATVVGFMPSRVKGLPQTTSEDMSSRITEEEAEAVRRWEKSKYGKNSIIIVRKIPFAIFIVCGTISYIVMRIVMTCL